MTYYIFLVFIDIGLFLSENWKELTFSMTKYGIIKIGLDGGRKGVSYFLPFKI